MSRQIQIRRGTAAEHENFTGAIGEITMDTTNKTLRVHDGETTGGTALAKSSQLPPASADYVIETQLPTAQNNYTWYRKYKSGWVEMGGELKTTGEHITLVFPISFIDTHYTFTVGVINLSGSAEFNHNTSASVFGKTSSKTKTSISIANLGQTWYACGVSE